MSTANPPSKDPADDGTLAGTFRAVFAKLMQGVDVMLPAVVVAYDRATNVATVKPRIAVLTTDGSVVSRAQLASVPVLALGGGGFVVNFPLAAGDLGWIEASDRDISLYLQSLDEAKPNTSRLHSFEDGRFIPDVMRQFEAEVPAGDEMTIQSLDGTVRMTLSPTKLRLVAPDVQIDANMLTVNSASTFNGLATFTQDTITNGRRFTTHKHLGVTTGGGVSGNPQ